MKSVFLFVSMFVLLLAGCGDKYQECKDECYDAWDFGSRNLGDTELQDARARCIEICIEKYK
jgi:hypothetical protein